MTELRVSDVHTDNDDSPLTGEREPVPHTVVETKVAGENVLEAVDVITHSGSPTRSTTRGLNVRAKKVPKASIMEMFIVQTQSDESARKYDAEQRAFEREERAADRTQWTQMIGSIAKGYFGQNDNKNRKSNKKKRIRRNNRRRSEAEYLSSDSSSESSSNDSSSKKRW